MKLTNCGNEKFNGIDDMHDVFEGVFCTAGEDPQHDGKYINRFEVEDDKVADNGDWDLDYDKAIETLKNEYPDFDEDQLDVLYDCTAKDEAGTDYSSLTDEFEYLEDFESRFKFQNLRGKIAADQGFDAICMNDEYGTSYFLPYGSSAKYLGSSHR